MKRSKVEDPDRLTIYLDQRNITINSQATKKASTLPRSCDRKCTAIASSSAIHNDIASISTIIRETNTATNSTSSISGVPYPHQQVHNSATPVPQDKRRKKKHSLVSVAQYFCNQIKDDKAREAHGCDKDVPASPAAATANVPREITSNFENSNLLSGNWGHRRALSDGYCAETGALAFSPLLYGTDAVENYWCDPAVVGGALQYDMDVPEYQFASEIYGDPNYCYATDLVQGYDGIGDWSDGGVAHGVEGHLSLSVSDLWAGYGENARLPGFQNDGYMTMGEYSYYCPGVENLYSIPTDSNEVGNYGYYDNGYYFSNAPPHLTNSVNRVHSESVTGGIRQRVAESLRKIAGSQSLLTDKKQVPDMPDVSKRNSSSLSSKLNDNKLNNSFHSVSSAQVLSCTIVKDTLEKIPPVVKRPNSKARNGCDSRLSSRNTDLSQADNAFENMKDYDDVSMNTLVHIDTSTPEPSTSAVQKNRFSRASKISKGSRMSMSSRLSKISRHSVASVGSCISNHSEPAAVNLLEHESGKHFNYRF